MSEKPPSEVLGALPRSRPHRRSEKRAARPVEAPAPAAEAPTTKPAVAKPAPKLAATKAAKPATAKQAPAKPAATPAKPAATVKKASAKPKVAAAPRAKPLSQPAQPDGTPAARRPSEQGRSDGHDLLGTAVQAAAEIAEIGLSASARAIRRAVSRLPRP